MSRGSLVAVSKLVFHVLRCFVIAQMLVVSFTGDAQAAPGTPTGGRGGSRTARATATGDSSALAKGNLTVDTASKETYKHGKELLDKGSYEAAVLALSAAISQNPKYVPAWVSRG